MQMSGVVTVAIPVRNGGLLLRRVLSAICAQRLDADVEVLVADSGSIDGSADAARAAGARVLPVAPGTFGHGRTRNLLMEAARGSHVAFLTQDAVPADDRWLARMIDGFALAADIALVYGPYLPRPDASPMVARELEDWFASFGAEPRVDRLQPSEHELPALRLLGPRAFFTDANGCVLRSAWERIPFPDVAYAEDHALSLRMLRAGYAKAYVPGAAVEHSHEYRLVDVLRRAFDEARGLREIYGWEPPAGVRAARAHVIGPVRADLRWARASEASRALLLGVAGRGTVHHAAKFGGTLLGSRAGRLPARLRRLLSLERRSTFEPTDQPSLP
jgi:rhamnosyltransferase